MPVFQISRTTSLLPNPLLVWDVKKSGYHSKPAIGMLWLCDDGQMRIAAM